MPYEHSSGYKIIPVSKSNCDVEPALEAEDPLGSAALDHLVSQHPDLFRVYEPIASEYAGKDKKLKMIILISMARAIGYLEQRPADEA